MEEPRPRDFPHRLCPQHRGPGSSIPYMLEKSNTFLLFSLPIFQPYQTPIKGAHSSYENVPPLFACAKNTSSKSLLSLFMVRGTAPAETTARTIPEATIAVLSPVAGLAFLVVVLAAGAQ